ncbi:hypothetical protein [Paracoccus spongiarum]|uniref:AAA+ family ATPase n=1 Tax=Paracoccus spongiarum TaxID=3064387 RepID=A0ABT9JBM5_9RHOB|nr:hypothetical protein [Paracoccus sp. 2205BS29-5]MDP5307223.1 hypothetical protein [Paracoccus sp. 2205BS29-5]
MSRALALSALLAAALLARPGLAQQQYEPPLAGPPEAEASDGLGLIERGVGIIMQNLLQDLGPDIDRLGEDMSAALSRMGPVLQDLSALVDDLANYQPPERQANGDILIRRKPGAPPPPPLGDSLRDFAPPGTPAPGVPRDPYAPEIEL